MFRQNMFYIKFDSANMILILLNLIMWIGSVDENFSSFFSFNYSSYEFANQLHCYISLQTSHQNHIQFTIRKFCLIYGYFFHVQFALIRMVDPNSETIINCISVTTDNSGMSGNTAIVSQTNFWQFRMVKMWVISYIIVRL